MLTREQLSAKESIRLYEGAERITERVKGRTLELHTDTGRTWTVSPAGNCVRDDRFEQFEDVLYLMAADPRSLAEPEIDEAEHRLEFRGWGGHEDDDLPDLRRSWREDDDHWDGLEGR